jgi:hypothetical protein
MLPRHEVSFTVYKIGTGVSTVNQHKTHVPIGLLFILLLTAIAWAQSSLQATGKTALLNLFRQGFEKAIWLAGVFAAVDI